MDNPAPTSDSIADCCPECNEVITNQPLAEAGDSPCPNCGHLLWFVRRAGDQVVVLTFLPGLMLSSESDERINEVLQAIGDGTRVLVNLSQVHILSSIVLGMLVGLHRRMEDRSGTLRICSLQPDVGEVFKMTKLDTILDIRASEADAMEGF
jgi:anti-sigma B factor antagonist